MGLKNNTYATRGSFPNLLEGGLPAYCANLPKVGQANKRWCPRAQKDFPPRKICSAGSGDDEPTLGHHCDPSGMGSRNAGLETVWKIILVNYLPSHLIVTLTCSCGKQASCLSSIWTDPAMVPLIEHPCVFSLLGIRRSCSCAPSKHPTVGGSESILDFRVGNIRH